MDEALRCHRLGFMRAGRFIAEGTPSQLRDTLAGRILELQTAEPIEMAAKAHAIPGVEDARAFGDKLHLRVDPRHSKEIIRLMGSLSGGAEPRSVTATLEDVFIALTDGTAGREVPHG